MKITVLIISILLLTAKCPAQNLFTTLVPKEPILSGESFQVQYIFKGSEKRSELSVPSFKNFRLVNGPQVYPGLSISNTISIPTYNTVYTLQALRPGLFKIPGAMIQAGGKLIRSNDAWVTVISKNDARKRLTQNGGQPDNLSFLRPGEDPYEKIKQNLFVKVAVNKKECFIGEPVVATFKLYSRLQSRSEIYKNPGLYGFTVQDMIGLDDKLVEEDMVKGKLFDVHTIRKVQLYPLQAGGFVIDAMEIKNKVEFSRSTVNNKTEQEIVEGIFDDESNTDTGSEEFETVIRSETINITVKPLPVKNKPSDFNGATGRFTIKAAIEKNELARNEEGYLLLTISGKGNFNQLSAPVVVWPEGMEGFEPVVTDSIDKTTVPMQGIKKFRYAFVAARAGQYEIAAIPFSYFNPDSNRYRTILSNAVQVNITTLAKAKPEIIKDKTSITSINHRASLVAGGIVAVLFLVILIYWLTKQKSKESPVVKKNPPSISIEETLRPASIMIPAADKDFYSVLYQSIWKYVASKYEINGMEMNKQVLTQKMEAAGNSTADIHQMLQLLQHCETGMFTQAILEEDKFLLLEKVKQLLEQMKNK